MEPEGRREGTASPSAQLWFCVPLAKGGVRVRGAEGEGHGDHGAADCDREDSDCWPSGVGRGIACKFTAGDQDRINVNIGADRRSRR